METTGIETNEINLNVADYQVTLDCGDRWVFVQRGGEVVASGFYGLDGEIDVDDPETPVTESEWQAIELALREATVGVDLPLDPGDR